MSKRLRVAVVAAVSAALMSAGCGAAQSTGAAGAQPSETVRIWPAAPPGTESWSGQEVELDADLPAGKTHIVTNVTVPTLAVFRPEAGRGNGAAMIVLPGGAFRALAWDLEGTELAQWLARRGITAFVLRYRVRSPEGGGAGGPESFDDFFRRTQPARQLALADAQQALRYVRANAGKFGITANRVGMAGFSAGAMVTMAAASADEAAGRPDFAASIYGAIAAGQAAPAGGPPLFVVATQDDPQVPAAKSVEIYERWRSARLPAELHLYEKGGHGFGIRSRNLPVDGWPAALEAWLVSRGLATAAPPPFRR